MGSQSAQLRKPPLGGAVVLSAAPVVIWAWVHFYLFQQTIAPLSYVVPLLVGVWARRPWLLWSMAGICVGLACVQIFSFTPDSTLPHENHWAALASRLVNIGVASGVVHAIILLRDRLEMRNASLAAANAELASMNEDLAAREEELAQQNEEIQSQSRELEEQSEELQAQSEELQMLNEELSQREGMLRKLLESARSLAGPRQVMEDICQCALQLVGGRVTNAAVVLKEGDDLVVEAHAGFGAEGPRCTRWPFETCFARIIMRENRTGSLKDLADRPDLRIPQPQKGVPLRSILASPLRVDGEAIGAVEFYASEPQEWTTEQFRLSEWLAAQCSLILEVLRLQERLEAAKATAESANAAKDKFLAMLSHELRTPLTPVVLSAQIMEADGGLPPRTREQVAMIRRNIETEARLVDDLLDLTRIARGKLQMQMEITDAHEALNRAVNVCMTEQVAARGMRVLPDLQAGRHCVRGDASRLQQVFWNLINNALKFTPDGGAVSIRSRQPENGLLRIEVSDTGMGIDPELIPRLFNAFEQGEVGSTHRFGGLGLGLAISRAIVEAHGGTIRAHSDGPGRGSVFTVELPLATDAPASEAPSQPPEPRQRRTGVRTQRLHLLVVEDHPDTARAMGRLLETCGYDVEVAASVQAALELVSRNGERVDLLISDVGLPDGTGLDLMRRLKELYGLKGIALSGYGTQDDIRRSAEAGFAEHLTKPISFDRLQDAIHRVLEGATDAPQARPVDATSD